MSLPTNFTPSSSLPTGGTLRWMSPELLDPEQFGSKNCLYTKASDCYALGMVILEVLSGKPPFPSDRDWIVARKVLDGERPERPRGAWFTDDLWKTLEQCWSPQPGGRPTVETVLELLERISTTWQSPSPEESIEDIRINISDSCSSLSYFSTFTRSISDHTFKHLCSGSNESPE